MNRIELCASRIDARYDRYSILDVGCRDKILKRFLKGIERYQGIDLEESEEVISCDLEKGIPFKDNEFDVVASLDVLEHLDNLHFVFHELLRVAKKAAYISLPNMYYWRFRFRFLVGKTIGGKYLMPTDAIKDRHRWLPSFTNSVDFVRANTAQGMELSVVPIQAERKRFFLLRWFEGLFIKIFPNAFAYGILFEITKS